VDIIKLLLDNGMSVNLTNTSNCKPLHVSAQSGNPEATKTLVERGGAINSTNKYGVTPLMVVAEHVKLEIFCYLTGIGADNNIRNTNKNKTAFHLAAASRIVDIIRLLLDKGMSFNLNESDEITPLRVCAEFGHLEATKALVERGAAINYTDRDGNTSLIVAAFKGKLEIFRYLLIYSMEQSPY